MKSNHPISSPDSDASRQYLSFRLGDEEYAVDILRVREIRVWEPPTPIPRTATFIKGVINLRGTVVPVIDLRERFGLPALAYGPRTVMIVLAVSVEGRERVMALVVEAVADVHSLTRQQIQPAPDLGGAISVEYVTGLATVGERMIVLVDSNRLLDLEEIYAIDALERETVDETVSAR